MVAVLRVFNSNLLLESYKSLQLLDCCGHNVFVFVVKLLLIINTWYVEKMLSEGFPRFAITNSIIKYIRIPTGDEKWKGCSASGIHKCRDV